MSAPLVKLADVDVVAAAVLPGGDAAELFYNATCSRHGTITYNPGPCYASLWSCCYYRNRNDKVPEKCSATQIFWSSFIAVSFSQAPNVLAVFDRFLGSFTDFITHSAVGNTFFLSVKYLAGQ